MIHFERILRKFFNPTLENEITQCAAEMEDKYSNYQQVVTLTDKDLKPQFKIVEVAFENDEVSVPSLSLMNHFDMPRKLMHQVDTIIYQGKYGSKVFKHRPRNSKMENLIETIEIVEIEK